MSVAEGSTLVPPHSGALRSRKGTGMILYSSGQIIKKEKKGMGEEWFYST